MPTLARCRERIARLNPSINAIVTFAEDSQDGEDGPPGGDRPLAGVPFTVKDSIETGGLRATAGTARLADHVPRADATAVARLRRAGAHLVGKTNVPPFATGFDTVNRVFGATQNPWAPDRSTGGSSGGGAAAVAAGMTAFDLASDTTGSVILPAHFCGVASHRPTPGVIPNDGHIPPGPDLRPTGDLPVFGVLAAGPADVDRVMDVFLAEPSQLNRPQPRPITVGFWDDDPACPVDAAVTAACRLARTALAAAGAQVQAWRPPVGLDEIAAAATFAAGTHAATMPVPPVVRARHQFAAAGFVPGLHRLGVDYARGLRADPSDQARQAERTLDLRTRFVRGLADLDAIVCPAAPVPAPPRAARRSRKVADMGLTYWPSPAAAFGLPATTTPVAVLDGLPVGLQVVGRPGTDRITLEIADRLYRATFALDPAARWAS
jgi:amidase